MDPKTGFYSKAAQIIRSYPSERGTAEQMIAFAKKAGVKPVELEQAKPPTGPITREELAQHFERNVPKIKVEQYGENPSYMKPGELGRLQSMSYSYGAGRRVPREGLTPEELSDYHVLSQKKHAQPDVMENDSTLYDEYTLDNGENYRERLLRLNQSEPQYHSSHWRGHPDVLAHIRLSDRSVGPTADFASAKAWVQPVVKEIAEHMGVKPSELGSGAAKYAVQNGMITPEEAATLTKIRGWQNEFTDQPGIGNKRLLHVEELQSDWAQEGRDKGFYDPAKPHQVFDWEGRKPLANYATEEEALEHIRSLPEGADVALRDMSTTNRPDMPPVAPYVTNTQHWTDLALKNVLREAALGNYDGVVFTPGQAQADRYGLDRFVQSLSFKRPQDGSSFGRLTANSLIGTALFDDEVKNAKHLQSLIGEEAADKLLSTQGVINHNEQTVNHYMSGDGLNGLKMGGHGMRTYYDDIVPKSVMRLAQMHDPDIKPGEPVDLPQGYQGFHLPMTDKLRQGILNEGYPAFKRGGRVGYSTGGNVGGMMMRMRRAGINTRDDFWNRWRDYMRAKAGPDTRLSMTLSPDNHFKRIDDMLGFHRQTADEKGLSQVLKSYGPPNEQGHMAARFPREILQGAGIEPTVENAHAVYEALPSDESGRVGFSNGGLSGDNDSGISHILNGEEHVKANAPAARVGTASRPQAGEFSVGRGVRGGSGLLQAPDEPPLEGLPAEVSIPMTGQVIQAGPDQRIRKVARDYMASTGMRYNPPTKYAKVDPSRSKRISDAYESMKDDASDPLTKASYDAMIKETMAQYYAAKAAGFKAEFWNPETDEDPYHASPRLATEDIRNNHHMWVYPTNAGYGSEGPITEEQIRKNPMLQLSGETWNGVPVTVNDIFRAVHDYFGHAKEGVGFRGNGEENAWRSHAAMFSPLARLAMTSETRGQNSWLNYGPFGDKNRKARTEESTFAPQKIGILPHWVHYEGAEDFMLPEDIEGMVRARAKHNVGMNKALAATRRFTKDGKGAMMDLKSK